MTPATFAACLLLSAQTHSVPAAVLIGIMRVEGGHVGQQVQNTNGSYDLGPMQVNTVWMPELARSWGVDQKTAYQWVRDDGCINVDVAAWILRRNLDQTGYLVGAIKNYHSATPALGVPYAQKVVAVMKRFGLIKNPAVASAAPAAAQLEAPDPGVRPTEISQTASSFPVDNPDD
jgi:hypothetical protein